MPRNASADQARVLALKDRRTELRVTVEDADGDFRDLTSLFGLNWVHSAEWGEDIDDQVSTATVELIREQHNYSLARDVETSRLNLDSAGAYGALVDVGRTIVIYTAIMPQDRAAGPADWVECFRGIVDRVDWSKPIVPIEARDHLGAQLQDLWVEAGDQVYGAPEPTGEAVQVSMQSILDDWGPQRPSIGDPDIDLYTPVDPLWQILEYHQEQTPVLEALTALAAQIGWVVRTVWDNGTGTWRMTFYEPDRAKSTPDFTITADDYFDVARCEVDLSTIRNVVEVVYSDVTIAEDANDATGGRRTETATDATSVGLYGRRWMQIAEASTSNINTDTEAQALATAAMQDLSEPKVAFVSTQKFDWRIQLGDLLRYTANGRHFTTDHDLAVMSYRHRIKDGYGRTEVTLRGQPAAYHDRWFEEFFARKGGGLTAKLGGQDTPTMSANPNPNGGVSLGIPWSRFRDFDHTEIHASTQTGFTPGPSTLVARGRQRHYFIPGLPGEPHYYRAVNVDLSGNRSSPSTEISATPGRAGPQLLHADAQWGGRFLGQGFGVQTRGANYPPDMWNMDSGTWGTDAELSTTVRKTGDSSLQINSDGALLVSDYIPVSGNDPYRFEIEWQADDTSEGNVWAFVEWYTSKGSVIGSGIDVVRFAADADDVWQVDTLRATAPSNARWVRLWITIEVTGTYTVFVDRFEAIKILPMFSAYLGADEGLSDNTWTPLPIGGEVYDLGNVHDAVTNFRFDVPASGLYSLSAGALFVDCTEYAQIALYVNGALRWVNGSDTSNLNEDADVRVSVSVENVQLDRADYVQVYVRAATSTGTLHVAGGTPDETWFTGRRVA